MSVTTAASHNAEVSGLTESLEKAKEELGQLKKQLEDKQGMKKTLLAFNANECFNMIKICFMVHSRGDDRSRGS